MAQNLGQLIQMLSVLGEMQDRRRQLALDETKLKQQGEQFALSAGIQKEDQRFNKVQALMKQIAEGGATAEVAAHNLAPMLGFNSQEAESFIHMTRNPAASLQAIQGDKAQFSLDREKAGYNSMNPAMQTVLNQEAAFTGETGANSGAAMTGQLIGRMAGQAGQNMTQNPDFSRRLGDAYAIRAGAGQTPFDFAKGQAGIDRGAAPAAMSVETGLTPSANAMLGYDGQMLDFYARQRAAMNQAGNISDTVSAINGLHQIAKDMADKKFADQGTHDTMMKQYNAMARLLQSQGVQVPPIYSDADAPSAAQRLELWVRGITGNNPAVSGSLPGQGGGKGGGGNPGQPFGGMRY